MQIRVQDERMHGFMLGHANTHAFFWAGRATILTPVLARWRGGIQPHRRGTRQSRAQQRWLCPQSGRGTGRDTFSQLCLPAAPHRGPAASLAVEAEPAATARRGSKLQQHPRPTVSHDFLGAREAAGRKAGGRRGGEVRNLLPKRTGRFLTVEGTTPFQQTACPLPNH